MENVMKSAWEIAYEGVAKFGGEVKEYFSEALKIAWDLFKKGGKEMKYANEVTGIIEHMDIPEIKGTEKQVDWAKKILMSAGATLKGEVIREEYQEVSLLPGRKPTTYRRDVSNLISVLQTKEGIEAHLVEMEVSGLPESRIKSTIETMNLTLGRYNRFVEIMSNADAKFWIDNRDNQAKNHGFNKFIKYVNTGVKEF